MVEVWMCRENHIYRAIPPRHYCRELSQHAAPAPTIDKHLPPGGRFNKYRVSLPDVEERDTEHSPAIFGNYGIPDAEREYEKKQDRRGVLRGQGAHRGRGERGVLHT